MVPVARHKMTFAIALAVSLFTGVPTATSQTQRNAQGKTSLELRPEEAQAVHRDKHPDDAQGL